MSRDNTGSSSRRGFLKSAGAVAAVAGGGFAQGAEARTQGSVATSIEPFYGARQSGILTPAQHHSYFAAFDLDANARNDVIAMLSSWTAAAAALTQGEEAPTPSGSNGPEDSTETLGLSPARLTLTFGFGAGLFMKDGRDRYGLAAARPDAFIDLPHFQGDQLIERRTGGDLSVQACADDPQVAFHAIRHFAELGYGTARLRWTQTGFLPHAKPGETPRNLMGFKDGTSNPDDEAALAKFVFVSSDGPAWMRGGSYVVARRILIGLEHWDRMNVDLQEQTIGRHRANGAPLGKTGEFDAPDLAALDKDGAPVLPAHAHIRLAAAENNGGARILRRPYSYNDGASYTAERWPPWRQGVQYDAGLFFVCYQRDPRQGFVKIFSKLAQFDLLNRFSTHTGGGLFACPGGIAPGEYVGESLFEG
ncbi:MAG TPA: Dyp-type peroxidase [Rhizomicrobium sp.]|jgi:deferrochelatase/peroxidase EfeB